MKLLNFQSIPGGASWFGLVIDGNAIAFETLVRKSGKAGTGLADVYSYLDQLPASEDAARELQQYGEANIASFTDVEKMSLEKIRILAPIANPRVLIDFGLSPRHLANSAATLLKHEFGFFGSLIAPLVRQRIRASAGAKMLYVKGNHTAVIGDQDTIHWPAYSSYLDIEPELALITGNEARPIAGYTILNDSSARDVQFWEMIGTGPARSKDFHHSKGLGPFLVTPDEVGDPLALAVKVKIGERFAWQGSTSEYCAHPAKALDYLKTVFLPPPGSVLGVGTIPDCTGLDNDLWINPGEQIEITFDKLGTLRQGMPTHLGKLEPSPWGYREGLRAFY